MMYMLALLGALLLSSAGAQNAGSTQSISITSGGRSRSFDLYTPRGWTSGSGPIPLVLSFHGWTSNPSFQARQTGGNTEADQYGWAIAYPAGIGNSFNAGGFCCGTASSENVDDVGFARDIVDEVGSRMSIDRNAVFSTGHSNGGYMTHRLACEASDLIRAGAPNAGRGSSTNCGSPVPMISFTGDADTTVRYTDYTRDRDRWISVNGCNANSMQRLQVTSTSYCELFTDCDGDSFVEYCTIEGGTHEWFNGPTDIDGSAYSFMRWSQILNGTSPGGNGGGQTNPPPTNPPPTDPIVITNPPVDPVSPVSPISPIDPVSPIAPPAQGGCGAARSGFEHQGGANRVGISISTSADNCCDNCNNNAECQGWTQSTWVCSLYDTPVDFTSSASGYTSGNKAQSSPIGGAAIGGIVGAGVVLLGGAGGAAYYKKRGKKGGPRNYSDDKPVEMKSNVSANYARRAGAAGEQNPTAV